MNNIVLTYPICEKGFPRALEIYAHTYAFSRENQSGPKTRRFGHFRNLRKQLLRYEKECDSLTSHF